METTRETLTGAAASQSDREDLDFLVEHDLLGNAFASAAERIRWYLGGAGAGREYHVPFRWIRAEHCSQFIGACTWRHLDLEPDEDGYTIRSAS